MVLYRFSHVRLSPFCNLLMYLLFVSFLGFLVLKPLRIRNAQESPKDIDMFFTAVSAATLSSLTTVEMEIFSNSQLIVLTILILLGGEAFISLLGLQFKRLNLKHEISLMEQNLADLVHPIGDTELKPNIVTITVVSDDDMRSGMPVRNKEMKYTAIVYLSYVVLGYLLVTHVAGTVAMATYFSSVSDARRILRGKDLNIITFSVFATVSSLSNCGFLPTNESMILFRKHLGLLLLVMPQSLLGGAMYPPALRSVLWLLKRITKKNKFEYILSDVEQIGYDHLFPWLHSLMLALTVLGFLLVQFVAICAMEWRNVASEGLSLFEKLINYLFLAVNARHTGESTLDLSTLTPAIMVLFVFIM
jgi:Trk-type K+ transport system membrane component